MSDGMTGREARAEAKAAKARAKAMRPWYQKAPFIIPLVFVGLVVIAAVASSSGDKSKESDDVAAGGSATTAAPAPASARLFPGRVDAQKEDQERNIGEAARLSGYTGTVTAASFRQSLSDFEKDGYIELAVTIENRDTKAQSYNTFDWKLQTPGGQVIDPTFTSSDEAMKSGDLVQGGSVSGKIFFEVKTQKGDFYIIYKPDQFDAARGIWKFTV